MIKNNQHTPGDRGSNTPWAKGPANLIAHAHSAGPGNVGPRANRSKTKYKHFLYIKLACSIKFAGPLAQGVLDPKRLNLVLI